MKSTKLTFLATLTLLGSFATTTIANADEATKPVTSSADVTIEKGDDTKPTDPIEPPEEPDKPTGQTGDLTIDYVTSLDFGSFKLGDNGAKSVKLTANKEREQEPKVQVTDKRGSGKGWTLTVAQTKVFKSAEHTLIGASLTLPAGTTSTSNATSDQAPTTKEVLVNDAPNEVMTAAAEQGLGTWVDTFEKEATTLEIPSGNYAGTYQAELTWTLSNAPQGE
ncbi:WxL domain-containing protein [Carnobacterium divergens]|uniref:WxL domain-containing protein n=1 Tax=Carnobacterium divergens TaxID=2748 RepID=A0AAW8R867_CARDV|nr:WxL domain-containing protein [Carnobacterium divergens]MDT1957105.1 WxL domain-containing protein [Carnobacterium divergens]MDT1973075.1 WxL domain-containing protein [Carnobacterium divergens]MDT2012745.1 WxL domain-containing protein [Carnobacterium divergens]